MCNFYDLPYNCCALNCIVFELERFGVRDLASPLTTTHHHYRQTNQVETSCSAAVTVQMLAVCSASASVSKQPSLATLHVMLDVPVLVLLNIIILPLT